MPERRRKACDEIRATVAQDGYDEGQVIFRMDHDHNHDDIDAAQIEAAIALRGGDIGD